MWSMMFLEGAVMPELFDNRGDFRKSGANCYGTYLRGR
jgi:hypothetical protein